MDEEIEIIDPIEDCDCGKDEMTLLTLCKNCKRIFLVKEEDERQELGNIGELLKHINQILGK